MYSFLVASRDIGLADRIAKAVESEATIVRIEPDIEALRSILPRVSSDIAMLDMSIANGFGERFQDATEELKNLCPGLRFLAIGDEGHASEVLASVRAGATDFLDHRASLAEIVERARRALGAADHKDKRRESELYVVVGGRQNEGESLFAINLAVMLARRNGGGNGVLLLDCSWPTCMADVALGIDSRYALRDAISDLPRLDRTLITTTLSRHAESGLYVLPLLNDISAQSASDANVSSVLSVLRGLLDAIVVNFGELRHSRVVVPALRSANAAYLYVTQSLAEVQSAQKLLVNADIGKNDRDRLTLVVGDYQDDIDLSDEQIAEALDIRAHIRLPAARAELINSLNAGRPLALFNPRSAYVREISRLLDAMQRRDAQAAEGGKIYSLIRRLIWAGGDEKQ
jgi:pilus assembly protein CpaE